jgi:oligoribonuclease
MRYISIDIETTGLDPEKNDIIEFGAVIDDLKELKPLEELPRFHTYILKTEYIGQPFPLAMHTQIFKRIADKEPGFQYTYPNKLGKAFKDFLLQNGFSPKEGSNHITVNVAGKNFAAFDLQFLKRLPKFCDDIRFSTRVLDPSILYFNIDDKRLPDMAECLNRAGIVKAVQHTSIEDALDVIRLLRHKLK